MSAEKNNVDFDLVFRYPFELKVANYLNQAIEECNEPRFNDLIALKNVLNRLSERKENDINVAHGSWLLEVSEEYLRLCFYRNSMDNDERFQQLLVEYMDRLMARNPLDSIREKQMERARKKTMTAQDSALLALLSDDIKRLLENANSEELALWEYRMMANSIVNWTNYYWLISPSDKVTRERCITWLNYACDMNPYNPEAPVNATVLLVHLARKKDALRHLEEAAALQEKAGNKNMRQVKQLELTLQGVKQGNKF